MKMKSITRKHHKGKVYDISVDVDKTYSINDCIVHNSAAGSLVLFALDITTLDPIKYGLLFERFLSQSRSPDVVFSYFEGETDE